MRTLELLAPAKDLACGIAAIDHGADAVYIGAMRFGARASAGNSVEDIRSLCQYAHQFQAKVYVTVNTIIYEDELEATRNLLEELRTAGVDAVLVQDMSLVGHCPLPLHASTQTDNRTAEKVAWLKSLGFARVVLARELSIEEIRSIHQQVPDIELEVFVHGALCVSYSGLCYASQYCFGRSANRGECAQFCRMKFNLVDADGKIVEHQRHLLSLKDMNQLANLEQLAKAGATSFKIEGRLKDVDYVKNVTAAYSQQLDKLIAAHPDCYRRASLGRTVHLFTPDLNRTFNRGYTTYFATGRQPDMASFDTPKAIGQYVGQVKSVKKGVCFSVDTSTSLYNGDGLCFMNAEHELQGFRVNRVEASSSRSGKGVTWLYPFKMPSSLSSGMSLYRNQDQQFETLLSKTSAERKLGVVMSLRATTDGFSLTMSFPDTSLQDVQVSIVHVHQQAQVDQRDNIVRQLTKLGGTPYYCKAVDIPSDFDYFIPSSRIAELRRMAVAECSLHKGKHRLSSPEGSVAETSSQPLPAYERSYFYNISNSQSRAFYATRGLSVAEDAFELHTPQQPLIMQCRYCLRYALSCCVKNGGRQPQWREPLSLQLSDGRRFPLVFDCRHCQMNVYAESR